MIRNPVKIEHILWNRHVLQHFFFIITKRKPKNEPNDETQNRKKEKDM